MLKPKNINPDREITIDIIKNCVLSTHNTILPDDEVFKKTLRAIETGKYLPDAREISMIEQIKGR